MNKANEYRIDTSGEAGTVYGIFENNRLIAWSANLDTIKKIVDIIMARDSNRAIGYRRI